MEKRGYCDDMEIDVISQEVIANIRKYFAIHLPRYEVIKVRKKSFHEDDAHLYMVAALKQDNTFTVWTSWNEKSQTLNHGHYDLPDMETCDRIMDEFYNGKN